MKLFPQRGIFCNFFDQNVIDHSTVYTFTWYSLCYASLCLSLSLPSFLSQLLPTAVIPKLLYLHGVDQVSSFEDVQITASM